ncbi:PP0621 family protein [Pseudomonas sp. NPDC007930]|uniref:PP0621 family protein n=1 Tax=Pseudomonas sp. NPDC007930 TaxID=3364417 RepID=UPI0036F0BA29
MVRLLFWIVVIFVAVWLWRKYKARAASAGQQRKQHTLTMVRCAHCGVHLPDDRAIRRNSHWFCSQAHLEQGPRQP